MSSNEMGAPPSSAHLTPEQIRKVFQSGISGVTSHLDECAACTEILNQLQLTMHTSGSEDSGCIHSERLALFAGGEQSATGAELSHISTCAICAERLKELLAVLTDSSPEEISGLKSSSRDWQLAMARSMATAAHAEEPTTAINSWSRAKISRWFGHPALAYTAAAVLLLLVSTGWWLKLRWPNVGQLLAESYSAHRTVEFRLPAASYGPIAAERGDSRSRLNSPPTLLEAEAIIAKSYRSHPEDPQVLSDKGLAELLEGDSASAVESLRLALRINPNSATTRIILAVALGQHGGAECTTQPKDCADAIELLGQVLAKDPNNVFALYNRALLNQKLALYPAALTDWDNLLRVEKDNAWRKEAQAYRDQVSQIISRQRAASQIPLLKPSAFLALAAKPRGQEEIDSRVEEYQELALTTWLPEAYRRHDSPDAASNKAAILALAKLLQERHGEPFLFALIEQGWPNPIEKFDLLASQIESSSKWQMQTTAMHLDELSLTQAELKSPFGLRLRLERVYKLQRMGKGRDCLRESSSLLESPLMVRFPWLHSQALLEKFDCEYMVGDLDQASRDVRLALEIAQHAGFPVLRLRAMGLATELHLDQGQFNLQWAEALQALKVFWSGVFPGARAYQLYISLSYGAEESQQWQLALTLCRSALEFADRNNPLFDGMIREHLGEIAVRAGENRESEIQFARAKLLFQSVSQDDAARRYELIAQVGEARLFLSQHRFQDAKSLLGRAGQTISFLGDDFVDFDYFRTLGELNYAEQHRDEALQAFDSALRISEKRLLSVKGEHDRLRWSQENGYVYRAAAEILLDEGQTKRALQIWESYKANATRLPSSLPRWVDQHDNQSSDLPVADSPENSFAGLNRATVLSYAFLPHELVVWQFDNRGVRVAHLSAPNLEQRIDRYLRECSDPQSDLLSLDLDATFLYESLLAPVSGLLSADRAVILEPDGSLSTIPFQTLLDQRGRYFGETHSITVSPGWNDLTRLRVSSAVSKRDHILVAATDGDLAGNSASALPGIATEAQAIASMFERSDLVVSEAATFFKIREGLEHSTIFHFAGHAFGSGSSFGLILSPEPSMPDSHQILDYIAVESLPVSRCRLVVLSACRTSSSISGLSDPENLVRAFLHAGAPQVIASKWAVDSQVTAKLMQAFYTKLIAGLSTADALRQAEESIRQDPATGHPYYWASFEVFGRPAREYLN